VLTFEELQALFDSRDFDITTLEEGVLDNASYFGRIFARTGGLTEATAQALKEQNIDFEVKPVVCDGIEACRVALLKLNKGLLDGNFIEGMACVGGCINGAGCLSHSEVKNKADVDKYGREAFEKTISDAVMLLK
jgi:iron only hydrogenase large subunit-like protein